MKTWVSFFLASMVLLFVACNNDETLNETGIENLKPSATLTDEQIKEKIAQYYASPSTFANPIDQIKSEFTKQFPKAKDIEWEYSKSVYEVDFEINGIDFEAWYDESANLIMYKYDIRSSELPATVQNAIKKDYSDYLIEDIEKVYKGTVVGYWVELEKGKSEQKAYYKEDGTLISGSIYESDNKPGGDTINPPAVEPNKPTAYTNEQIDALLTQYYAAHSKDVVPATTLTTGFKGQFPNARDVEWEVANNVYNVDFEINNVDYEAWYDSDGYLLMYTYDIQQTALPEVVKAAIKNKYPDYRMEDTEKVVKGSVVGYSVELEKGNREVDALFKEDGTFLLEFEY